MGSFDFWWWLSTNLIILITVGAVTDPSFRQAIRQDFNDRILSKLGLGILSAFFLYGLFALGNVAARQLFAFAGSGIQDVYAFKLDASQIRIAMLMLIIIGPGEELFWRGFLQRRYQNSAGPGPGYLIVTGIYALVHVGSGNIMLVLAAAVCGLFWGYLYLRFNSMILNISSHTLWDLAVFLWLPFH